MTLVRKAECRKQMKKSVNIFCLFLCSVLMFSCQSSKREYQIEHKIVLAKTLTNDGDYLVAFTDGSQGNFNFAAYSMFEVNDTLDFKCIKDFSFNKWNCSFIGVRKHK